LTEEPPSKAERSLIARCMMECGELIADDEEQVWTHHLPYKALVTWRMCIDAITELIGGGHGVQASFVKACVMQTEGLRDAPYLLDELAEFMIVDGRARKYWDSLTTDKWYPHRCPHCGAAAFVGFLQVDCKGRCTASCPR
jgi:hypothetical protein